MLKEKLKFNTLYNDKEVLISYYPDVKYGFIYSLCNYDNYNKYNVDSYLIDLSKKEIWIKGDSIKDLDYIEIDILRTLKDYYKIDFKIIYNVDFFDSNFVQFRI